MDFEQDFVIADGESAISAVLPESSLEVIREEMANPRSRGVETGGVLLGKNTAPDQVVILSATGPGPDANHFSAQFAPDVDHAQARLDELRQGWDVFWIGTWHKHPGHLNRPSQGDINQMEEFISDPDNLNAITAIITTRTPQGKIRINTFYMDERRTVERIGLNIVSDNSEVIQSLCDTESESTEVADPNTTNSVHSDPLTTDNLGDSGAMKDLSETTNSRNTRGLLNGRLRHPIYWLNNSLPTSMWPNSTGSSPNESCQTNPESLLDDTSVDSTPSHRLKETYRELDSHAAVVNSEITQGDDFQFIRLHLETGLVLIFACPEKFPENPPRVLYQDDGLNEFEDEYIEDWSSIESLVDVFETIITTETQYESSSCSNHWSE